MTWSWNLKKPLRVRTQAEFDAAVSENAADPVIDFVFPVAAVDADGNAMTFNDNAELGRSFASCIPQTGWTASARSGNTIPACLMGTLFCYDFVYPLDLVDEDGNSYTANNEQEFIDLYATIPTLAFTLPLSLIDSDGNTVVVNTFEEFFDLAFECDFITPPATGEGIEVQGFGCLDLVYPANVVTPDGTVIVIQNEDDYANLILSGTEVELQYPFSLVDSSGTVIVVEEILDLIDALASCGVLIETENTDSVLCGVVDAHVLLFFNGLNIFTVNNYPYDINYPVTLIVEGNPVVVNNDDEYLPAIGGSPSNLKPTDIQYPISITQFGRVLVFNNDEEVCAFHRTLDEDCVNKPGHIQFFFNEGPGRPISCTYFIEYPVEIELNGNTIQIPSREDYLNQLTGQAAYDNIELVYPVSALRFEDGQQVTFGSDTELCDYLDTCF